eukprot:scaffold27527_cov150-Skeletonema_marinoi.AAC.4
MLLPSSALLVATDDDVMNGVAPRGRIIEHQSNQRQVFIVHSYDISYCEAAVCEEKMSTL